MELNRDRLAVFLRVFLDGPGLTQGALAEKSGLSRDVLNPDYESEPGPETLAKLARGAAKILPLDEAQVLAWLHSEDDPSLQAYLYELLNLRECTRCKGWFPEDRMVVPLSRCRPCHRDDSRNKEFQRRLANDADLAEYYRSLYAALPVVREKDPDLHAALQALKGEAITRPKLGRKMGISAKQVLQRLLAVGLSEMLLAISLGVGGAQARPEPLQPAHISASTGGRRRRKGAAPEAAPPPRKKKGRRGRQPGEAAGEVSRRRLPPQSRALRESRRGAGAGQLVLFAAGAAGGGGR